MKEGALRISDRLGWKLKDAIGLSGDHSSVAWTYSSPRLSFHLDLPDLFGRRLFPSGQRGIAAGRRCLCPISLQQKRETVSIAVKSACVCRSPPAAPPWLRAPEGFGSRPRFFL